VHIDEYLYHPGIRKDLLDSEFEISPNTRLIIGSDKTCDVVLPLPFIGKLSAFELKLLI
jgi:hypothetical protein